MFTFRGRISGCKREQFFFHKFGLGDCTLVGTCRSSAPAEDHRSPFPSHVTCMVCGTCRMIHGCCQKAGFPTINIHINFVVQIHENNRIIIQNHYCDKYTYHPMGVMKNPLPHSLQQKHSRNRSSCNQGTRRSQLPDYMSPNHCSIGRRKVFIFIQWRYPN